MAPSESPCVRAPGNDEHSFFNAVHRQTRRWHRRNHRVRERRGMNSPARNRKPLTGLGRDRKDVVSENGRQNRGFPIPLALFLGSFRPSPDRGFLFRAGEFIPRRSGTTGVGNSFPGALAHDDFTWHCLVWRCTASTNEPSSSPGGSAPRNSDFAIALTGGSIHELSGSWLPHPQPRHTQTPVLILLQPVNAWAAQRV